MDTQEAARKFPQDVKRAMCHLCRRERNGHLFWGMAARPESLRKRSDFDARAPEGAIGDKALTVRLKAYPDTKPDFVFRL
jgi:hypothetical protein